MASHSIDHEGTRGPGQRKDVPTSITCATGFPTTVNPILQNGLIPVFLDVELGTYNIDISHLEEALTLRTRAIMIAHALGNPFNLGVIAD
jgi:CDP-4-dehydro-6-deoxyglucose reductase, E1